MNFTYTLDAVQTKALEKAAATQSSAQPKLEDGTDAPAITPEAYLSSVLASVLSSYSDQYLRVSSAAFVLRFAPAEIQAITAAGKANEQVAALLTELTEAQTVHTGSARVRGGIALLAQAGLLTQARASEILDV